MKSNKPIRDLSEVEVMFAFDTADARNLQGRLLTLVDASTADVEQRKALKDLVTQNVWDWVHSLSMRVERSEAKYIATFPAGGYTK